MEYTVIRSKRKTIAIYVRGNAVTVRCPLRASLEEVDGIVKRNKKWILKRLCEENKKTETRENFSLTYSDSISVLGKPHILSISKGSFNGRDGDIIYLPPGLDHEGIMNACRHIYRSLAKSYFQERADFHSKSMGVSPAAVKVSDAKKRWGSCSAQKSINLSWRLMMTDPDTVDYVIVHELAHIYEMNHSKKFWKIVEKILPDYKARQKKLKTLTEKVDSEGW